MAGAKVVVLYPPTLDVEAFERAYARDHAPMVTPENFTGMTKFAAMRVKGTPDGSPAAFHRIAELHFPSMEVLQTAGGSAAAEKVVAHAISISSGGPPVFLITEEEITSF